MSSPGSAEVGKEAACLYCISINILEKYNKVKILALSRRVFRGTMQILRGLVVIWMSILVRISCKAFNHLFSKAFYKEKLLKKKDQYQFSFIFILYALSEQLLSKSPLKISNECHSCN